MQRARNYLLASWVQNGETSELKETAGRTVEVDVRTVFLLELVTVAQPPSPPLLQLSGQVKESAPFSFSMTTSLTMSETWSEVEQAPSVSSPPHMLPPSREAKEERPVRGKLLSVCCNSVSKSNCGGARRVDPPPSSLGNELHKMSIRVTSGSWY